METAIRAGVGGAFDLALGGKTDDRHGRPVRHGGLRYWDMGVSALIEVDGSTPDLPSYLLLTPKRVIPFSLHQLISVGV